MSAPKKRPKLIGYVALGLDRNPCWLGRLGEVTDCPLGAMTYEKFFLFKTKKDFLRAVALAEKKDGHELTSFEAFPVYQ